MYKDSFHDSRINMPVEQKKAFEDQLKALNQQQKTIKSLIDTTERQATIVKALLIETKQQGKRSGIQSMLSLIFSLVAVLIAGAAVWFSYQDFKSDEVWQQEQIKTLKEIRKSIKP